MQQFAAPHAASFMRHYERMRARANATGPGCAPGRLPFVLSWHWPAFIMTVPWMFYRKMYSGGIILVAMPVFLDHILPGSLFLGSGIAIAITAGICGKSWYVEHAIRRMAKARRSHDNDDARAAYMARASGVSLSAGIFGALIQIVTVTVIVMDLLPPNRF
jgi:hypothetical protein